MCNANVCINLFRVYKLIMSASEAPRLTKKHGDDYVVGGIKCPEPECPNRVLTYISSMERHLKNSKKHKLSIEEVKSKMETIREEVEKGAREEVAGVGTWRMLSREEAAREAQKGAKVEAAGVGTTEEVEQGAEEAVENTGRGEYFVFKLPNFLTTLFPIFLKM